MDIVTMYELEVAPIIWQKILEIYLYLNRYFGDVWTRCGSNKMARDSQYSCHIYQKLLL